MGVEIVELDLPSAGAGHEVTLTLLMAEAGQFHQQRLAAHREDYGVDVRELLEKGLSLSASDYIKAIRVREIAKREFAGAFEEVDCILSPTAPIPAPLRSTHDLSGGSESNRIRPRLTQNTRLLNLLGLPSFRCRVALHRSKIPIAKRACLSGYRFQARGGLKKRCFKSLMLMNVPHLGTL